MSNVVSKKLIVLSVATALISGALTLTANAAMEVTVSSVPAAATALALPEIAPEVPASDFSANATVSPQFVIMRPCGVVIPEPGTLFAGFGILTYFLFKTGRRTRS